MRGVFGKGGSRKRAKCFGGRAHMGAMAKGCTYTCKSARELASDPSEGPAAMLFARRSKVLHSIGRDQGLGWW